VRTKRPFVIAVGGFGSDTGKTTLVCELLRALPGSEAVKTTRGHYRSCGKDPHACCVAPLLGAEPLILSGRAETYAPGKDTGRYWDAGASNVHWVVAANGQVEEGFSRALGRVMAPLVVVEGNSFLRRFEADFVLMAVSTAGLKIKPTARHALGRASAFYLASASGRVTGADLEAFAALLGREGYGELLGRTIVYRPETLGRLIERVREVCERRGAACPAVIEAAATENAEGR
jgi:molybdopterin-guanine dinucleotide biosynthesis protein